MPEVECHFAKASQLYKIVNIKQRNNNNIFHGEVSIWLLPLVQVSHVDGPVVCSRGETLRPAIDVGETETTAQRTLAAGRGQRAQTRA